jgi:hypothetical protein
MSAVMQITGRRISNAELNNAQTYEDILTIINSKGLNVLERKRTLYDQLKEKSLPLNMMYIPSRRDLMENKDKLF